MHSFTEIIQALGRDNVVSRVADDLGIEDRGSQKFRRLKERVRGWERYDTVPPEYWKAILDMAPEKNIDISPYLLMDLAARD